MLLAKLDSGKDVIGLAQTGSGKTGAFSLPILQELMGTPQEHFALVLSPTRELAIQIAEQIEALGLGIGVKCAVLVGGIDMMAQAISLAKRPHIIVGTPGRVVDHLSNTKVRSRARQQRCVTVCGTHLKQDGGEGVVHQRALSGGVVEPNSHLSGRGSFL